MVSDTVKRPIECAVCGITYFTSASNSKYCSLECKEKARKIKAKEWKDNHPNFYKDYAREYRRKKAESILT